ncbi:ABC transporter ATP-binding protein [Shinella sp. BYT-45]|uniref:ABC transporter ATP-binding protein n=1 Tax=Shinella sp. BYT-45 TaxID=3377377 RepID=UPI0039815799
MRKSLPTRVTLSAVTKSFRKDEQSILIEDLTIEPGELLTLVGPSGCGKTTTMRMIAGLEEPSSGDILFGGRRINDVPVQNRNVAMVFQNYALYPHLRVTDNLQYGLKKRGVPAKQRQEKVEWVSKLLHIESLLERKPRQISGGEQQRVALGRAIIRDPDVLLLDEPLSNLDAKLRMIMRAELVKLQRQIGCTTVFVTHDQLEAMTMSDRIVVIEKGRVQQIGAPAEIYNAPNSVFVATFMGSPPMNLLKGDIVISGSELTFSCTGMRIRVPLVGPTPPGADNGPVTLGVRPEHITFDAEEGDFPADVVLVEFVGAEKFVFLQTQVGQMIARVNVNFPVAPNDRLNCTLDRSKLNFFAEESGARLALAV